MNSFQAIATDLDGTLLRSDGTVSARTRTAVMAAEDSGLRFVIATGRPPRWIAPIVEQLGDRGLVICANGAAVYDPAEHRLVSCIELKAEVVLSLVDEIQENSHQCKFQFHSLRTHAMDTPTGLAGSAPSHSSGRAPGC